MFVTFISLVFGSIGSHIFRLIETGNYEQILSINIFKSGMNFLGGMLLVVSVLFIFTRFYRKISFIEIVAACSPAIILGYSIARIGCFLAGDGCYGIPADLPWCMAFPNGTVPTLQKVHPTPIYETLLCLLLFIVLIKNFDYKNFIVIKYKIIYLALIGFGIERFVIEFVRRNAIFYGLTQAQWISLFFILLALPFIFKYYNVKGS